MLSTSSQWRYSQWDTKSQCLLLIQLQLLFPFFPLCACLSVQCFSSACGPALNSPFPIVHQPHDHHNCDLRFKWTSVHFSDLFKFRAHPSTSSYVIIQPTFTLSIIQPQPFHQTTCCSSLCLCYSTQVSLSNIFIISTGLLINIFFCALGLSITVVQTEKGFVADPRSNVKIDCSLVGYKMSSASMYWYRQKTFGAEIKMVTSEYEKSKGRFQSEFENHNTVFFLRIKELIPDDTGTYYCAATHSGAFNHITLQITLT